MIKDQFLYSVNCLSAMSSRARAFRANIRMTMTVQETTQHVRIKRHAVDEFDSLEGAWQLK
jgi:hypothetical protein